MSCCPCYSTCASRPGSCLRARGCPAVSPPRPTPSATSAPQATCCAWLTAPSYRAKRSAADQPVAAGRPLAPDVAAVLSSEAGSIVRSPRAGRRPSDASHAMVAQVVGLLDGKPRASALDCLATVGAAVVAATDAGAWWVSVVPAGADTLHSLRYGSSRPAAAPGQLWRQYFELGAVMALAQFPDTERVVTGGWAEHRLDDVPGDPAEHEVLRQGGGTWAWSLPAVPAVRSAGCSRSSPTTSARR